MTRVPHVTAIGSLMYAMLYTWLDVCFAIGWIRHF